MSGKRFFKDPDTFKPLATGLGSCFASDRITVDGCKVGYMYREQPDDPGHPTDSGWRFFAGDESDEYAPDPNNFSIFDVNTIANYDPEITVFLEAEYGTAYAIDERGRFIQEAFVPTIEH